MDVDKPTCMDDGESVCVCKTFSRDTKLPKNLYQNPEYMYDQVALPVDIAW